MTTMAALRTTGRVWTVDDMDALPEDGMRHELIDGTLVVSPAEGLHNVLAAHRLCIVLETALGKDWLALPGGAGYRLEELTQLKPDVLVFPRSAMREKEIYAGEPAVVVEMMSPSSRTMDRVTKPAKYAEAGLPHYWRLERQPSLVLVTYALDGDGYRETGRFTDEVVIDDPVRLRFRLADLLE